MVKVDGKSLCNGIFLKLRVPPVAFTASLESSSYFVYFKVHKMSHSILIMLSKQRGDIIVIEELLFNEFTGPWGPSLRAYMIKSLAVLCAAP